MRWTRLAATAAAAAAIATSTVLGLAEGPPAAGDDRPDAVIEVVVETLRPGADPLPLALAVGRAHAQRPGFVHGSAARMAGPAPRLLRIAAWASVADAEAASLAADGSAETLALAAAVESDARLQLHARRLRAHVYDRSPGGHLEVTVFRTTPGTTREQHLARFDAAEADFAEAEGLLGHALYLAPDGRWLHEVRWRSEADFVATGKALLRTAGVGAWIRSLDYGRFSVLRGDRLGG